MTTDFIAELDVDFLVDALDTALRKLSRVERQLRAFIQRTRAVRSFTCFVTPTILPTQEYVRRMTLAQVGFQVGFQERRSSPKFLYHPLAYRRPVMIFDWRGSFEVPP